MAFSVPSAFLVPQNECYILPFADPYTEAEFVNPSPSRPPIGPISGISVTNVTSTGFRVSLNPVSRATNYSFQWGSFNVNNTQPGAIFLNLPVNTTNSLSISAYNEDGAVVSVPQNVSTLLPFPDIPGGIFITNLGATGFTGNWEPAEFATSYTAVWGTTGGSISGTTAVFTGLPSGQTQNFVVTATNSSGSVTSIPYPVTTIPAPPPPPPPPAPAKPTGFTNLIQGTSYVKIKWTNDPTVTYTATLSGNSVTVFTDEPEPYVNPTGLAHTSSFNLVVTATDANGSTPSDPYFVSTLAPRTISQFGLAASPPYPSAPFYSIIGNATIPFDFDITNNSDTSNPEWLSLTIPSSSLQSLLGTDPLNPSGDEIRIEVVSNRFSAVVNNFTTYSVNGENLVIVTGYTTSTSWTPYVGANEDFEIWLYLDGTISLLDTTNIMYSFTYNPVVFNP